MKPEWSDSAEAIPTMVLYGLGGLISFVLMVVVFAFYW